MAGNLLTRSLKVIDGNINANTIKITTMNTLADICADNTPMGFPHVNPDVLSWEHRKHLLIEEITMHKPDFICLQEVDHWIDWFQPELQKRGYHGYYAKGDRHGLVIAYTSNWKLKSDMVSRQLIPNASQMVLYGTFESDNHVITVLTTHLKAKKPFADIRLQQGQELMNIVANKDKVLLVGDFNASPDEPVIGLIEKSLKSAFYEPYTTAKVREKLTCHTIDYIFYKDLLLTKCIEIPPISSIEPDYLPRIDYPSDHFSLTAEFA